jgi:hypothetical protein
MIIRKLDSTGDWTFGKGLSNYLSAEMAIEQNIQTRLLSWKNDCFFALQEGVDYRNLLDKGQEKNLKQAIKAVILTCEGVLAVREIFAVLGSNRNLTISYSIDTIYTSNVQNTIARELT